MAALIALLVAARAAVGRDYVAAFLDTVSRNTLCAYASIATGSTLSPSRSTCDHVTIAYDPDPPALLSASHVFGRRVSVRLIAIAGDGHVTAALVGLEGATSDNAFPHVTLLLNGDQTRASYSNCLWERVAASSTAHISTDAQGSPNELSFLDGRLSWQGELPPVRCSEAHGGRYPAGEAWAVLPPRGRGHLQINATMCLHSKWDRLLDVCGRVGASGQEECAV